MQDAGRDTIHSELRLIAAVRQVAREHGATPSMEQIDVLLDERAHAVSDAQDVTRQ